MATPSSRPSSALSGTGTGGGPSPVTPGAKAALSRSATSGRRTSLMTRPNGLSSPASPSVSPLAGKGVGDGELSRLTRDQMMALIASERKAHEEGRRKREEAEEALAKALEDAEDKERRLTAMQTGLVDKEKDMGRMEEELARRVAEADQWEAQSKELDRVKAQIKESERKQREQAESFEAERVTWLDRERHLKSRISSLSRDSPSPLRRLTDLPEEPEDENTTLAVGTARSERADSTASAQSTGTTNSKDSPPNSALSDGLLAPREEGGEIQFRRSPSLRTSRPHIPKELKVPASPSSSTASLSVTPPTPTGPSGRKATTGSTIPGVPLPPEMLAELAELRALATSHEALQNELEDMKRVNAQLMEENESYELLVGEKTLAGELDFKALLRNSTFGSSSEGDADETSEEGLTSFSTVNTSISASPLQLEDVKEEGEEEDEVERMILESQGSGSRTTGAVEAETAPSKKKKGRASAGAANGASLGLDLAAELEKAEEVEAAEAHQREQSPPKKGASPSKHSSSSVVPNEIAVLRAENRNLKDANKALALYISKIIDRIVAMDGFEKVLSVDFGSGNDGAGKSNSGKPSLNVSSGKAAAASTATLKTTAKPADKEKPAKRMSLDWRTLSPTALFGGGGQPKPAAPAQSPPPPPVLPGMKPLTLTGQQRPDEDEEDAKERERLRAEMKLHGYENSGSPQLHAPFSSRSGSESPSALGIEQALDATSSDAGDRSSTRASRRGSSFYGAMTSPTPSTEGPVTAATVLKREEDREREIKANLERGAAGGFTEISRTRRRPSMKDRERAASGTSVRSSGSTPAGSVRSRPVSPMLPPLPDEAEQEAKDVPPLPSANAASEGKTEPATAPSDSMLSRAAKRLSMSWGPRPDVKSPEGPMSPK